MRKNGLIVLMAIAYLIALTGISVAADITPTVYNIANNQLISNEERNRRVDNVVRGAADYNDYVQEDVANVYLPTYNGVDLRNSTHPQGTWNSPYTYGIDGYNYNDPQDYVKIGTQKLTASPFGNVMRFESGPHGRYITTTHKCRECHAVHRAAGKFKLTRVSDRFLACDWCHGTGAGSGFNIQMDNDDLYTREYNVGHTMGFGLQNGKWKAPDDTYPAFTPPFWLGGFSCFDCHSPHANPQRLLGYNQFGIPTGYKHTVRNPGLPVTYSDYVFGIINPGHAPVSKGPGEGESCDDFACHKGGQTQTSIPRLPLYLSGSWILIKNPDKELAATTETVRYYKVGDYTWDNAGTPWVTAIPNGVQPGGFVEDTVTPGQEISDMIYGYSELIDKVATVTAGNMNQFSSDYKYPVQKFPIDWSTPIGVTEHDYSTIAANIRNPLKPYNQLNEFCADCHDGNAGLSTIQAPMFSEDRALRDQTITSGVREDTNFTSTPSVESTGTTDTAAHYKGEYDIAYSHDSNVRHCKRQMNFNPEDNINVGPSCRNCHRGSSSCGRCHNNAYPLDYGMSEWKFYTNDPVVSANNLKYKTTFDILLTTTAFKPGVLEENTPYDNIGLDYGSHDAGTSTYNSGKQGNYPFTYTWKANRTVQWVAQWRASEGRVDIGQVMDPGTPTGDIEHNPTPIACSDDGFSWPHRTLGWKMLKDDLFGLDFTNSEILPVGGIREYDANMNGIIDIPSEQFEAHDLDSVCLDCHNPTVWRATSSSHIDTITPGLMLEDGVDEPTLKPADVNNTDDYNDDLLLRGLP